MYVYEWHTHEQNGETYSAPETLYISKKVRETEITLLYQDSRFYLIMDRPAYGREAFFAIDRDLTHSRDTRTCHRCMDTFTYKKGKECEFTRHMARKDCTIEEDNDVTHPSARLPEGREAFLRFKDFAHQNDHPCVVVADFETVQNKASDPK